MLVLILILASMASWAQIPVGGGGGTGDVGGASNLTTVGAIPYVSAAGILNQDPPALFWDAANDYFYAGGYSSPSNYSVRLGPGNGEISIRAGAGAITHSGSNMAIGSTASMSFNSNSAERARFATTTGNLLIGTTTDSNFKLDVAASGSAGTARFYDQTATTGTTKAVFRNGAGQTGSLIEIQTSGGITVGSISTGGLSMPSVASDGSLFGVTHQIGNTGKIEFSNGTIYSQGIRRRSDAIIAFDNNTAIGTTPGNARDVMVRGVYAAETTSDPSAGDLSIAGANAQDTFRLYMKNDKLVVAYQISGTVNYLTIPLDGATTTWTQSTTAP